jgi:hypothetical protein
MVALIPPSPEPDVFLVEEEPAFGAITALPRFNAFNASTPCDATARDCKTNSPPSASSGT